MLGFFWRLTLAPWIPPPSPRPVSASPSPLQGRKVEKSKKSNISSKIDQFDLPARGRKVEKSKKFNRYKNTIVKSCIMYKITWRKNIRIQGYRICPLASRVAFKNVSAELFFFWYGVFYRVTGYILWLLFLGKKSPDLFFLIWCVLQGYRICLLVPIFHHANLHKQTTKKFSKIHNIIRQKNQTWYLLGSKSHWIIGQKCQNVAQYRCVLIKKTTLSNVIPIGIKITIDNW